jgi:hypothetical protein
VAGRVVRVEHAQAAELLQQHFLQVRPLWPIEARPHIGSIPPDTVASRRDETRSALVWSRQEGADGEGSGPLSRRRKRRTAWCFVSPGLSSAAQLSVVVWKISQKFPAATRPNSSTSA